MNPAGVLPVSPSQPQTKIDEVLSRLHRLALESGALPGDPNAHTTSNTYALSSPSPPAALGIAPAPAPQMPDTDSVSSSSPSSHSHSHTFSNTTQGTAATTTSATTTSSNSLSSHGTPSSSPSHTTPAQAHAQPYGQYYASSSPHPPQPQPQLNVRPQHQPQHPPFTFAPFPSPHQHQHHSPPTPSLHSIHNTQNSPHNPHAPNQPPNFANVASLYRLGLPSRLTGPGPGQGQGQGQGQGMQMQMQAVGGGGYACPSPGIGIGFGPGCAPGAAPGMGMGVHGQPRMPLTPPQSASEGSGMGMSVGMGGAGMNMGMQMGMGGLDMGQGAGGLGTGKAYSYRPGDWICVSPACSYPNFGRNEFCNACRCPRPTNGLPRAGGGPLAVPQHQHQHQAYAPSYPQADQQLVNNGSPGLGFRPQMPRLPTAQAAGMGNGMGTGMLYNSAGAGGSPVSAGVGSGMMGGLGMGMGMGMGVGAGPGVADAARSPMIVTPSGRAFANMGSRKNVSGDDNNPVLIFWPDNEPVPEPGQVRPNMVGLSQPPILNTGNKGPIEHQPGDWYCQKCEHLNWRRRKVCQNCYRFAEGNEDDTTLARQAECISVLIAQLVAAKKAQEAGVMLNLNSMMGVGLADSPGPASAGAGDDGQMQMMPAAGVGIGSPGARMGLGQTYPPSQQTPFERHAHMQRSMSASMSQSQSLPAMPMPIRSLPAGHLLGTSMNNGPPAGLQYPSHSLGPAPNPNQILPSVLQHKALATLPALQPAEGHPRLLPAGAVAATEGAVGAGAPLSPCSSRTTTSSISTSGAIIGNKHSTSLAPINTSPTSLRSAGKTRVTPPITPLDPPKSARTNIWGTAYAAGSPASKWPDFASSKRLSPPQDLDRGPGMGMGVGMGTPSLSPRGSIAESANGSGGSGSARVSLVDGFGFGGKAFGAACGTSAAGTVNNNVNGNGNAHAVANANAGVGPFGSPVVAGGASAGQTFRTSHPRLAGLHRA